MLPFGICGQPVVSMDLDSATNPAVSMEWTDANGALYTGQTMIPALATDTSGGALPGGSVRWRNVGHHRRHTCRHLHRLFHPHTRRLSFRHPLLRLRLHRQHRRLLGGVVDRVGCELQDDRHGNDGGGIGAVEPAALAHG